MRIKNASGVEHQLEISRRSILTAIGQLFYAFDLDAVVPVDPLGREIAAFRI